MSPRTMTILRWSLLALLGLVAAVAVGVAAAALTSQQIGLSSEPIRAGEALAPHRGGEDRRRSGRRDDHGSGGRGGESSSTTTSSTPPTTPVPPTTTTPPLTTAPAPTPTAPAPTTSSDDSGHEEGGDD